MKKGFTLVELAIVITIIGLLIGGVLKGQEMLENARITSAFSKIKSYNSAAVTFKDIYKALPGDLINPANFLANCTTAPCNASGNGDGIIGPVNGGSNDENYNFWFHMSRAGLITGIDPNGSWATGAGGAPLSAPAFDLGNTLGIYSYSHAASATYPEGLLGTYYTVYIITPLVAKLDIKADDTRPWTGSINVLTTSCGMPDGATSYDPNSRAICYAGIRGEFR